MADTTTVTCTEKRQNGSGDPYATASVYVRTFTFPVTASEDNTDVLNLITIPAGTFIMDAAFKSSVAQTNSSTLALNITGKAAFATSLALTTSMVPCNAAVADKDVAYADTDSVLQATIGGGDMIAGTITISLVCAALEPEVATYTTYTI